jgi:hypothetical protein
MPTVFGVLRSEQRNKSGSYQANVLSRSVDAFLVSPIINDQLHVGRGRMGVWKMHANEVVEEATMETTGRC